MYEYGKMSISELKIELNKYTPCTSAKCSTDPRNEYAWRLWLGKGVPQDKMEAFVYFKEAADHGHEGAQYKVGYCYYTGEGIPQNFEKAMKYFMRLLQKHSYTQVANLWIGKCYLKIKQRNEEKAIECFKKVAMDNRVSTLEIDSKNEALLLLGICYYKGVFVEKDFNKAFDYLEQAAIHNNDARYYLAECYHKGIGTQINLDMYRFWLTKCLEESMKISKQNINDVLGIKTPDDLIC